LDLCGGQILEFETDPNEPIAERRVPLTHEEIVEYQKKRSAFNHMTVMFKKSKVLEAGNYKNCPLMEDDMLWGDMILAGAQCMNIDEYLCKVRTNRDMIARRGGLKYYKKYKTARKQIYKTGFISYGQYSKTNFIQFLVCIMPKRLRKFVFFHLIHKKSGQ
ncbi:MAG: amylovoran biosynthesis protein AmsE, partial [Clostridia bacterium]|nr:amylovoran biosynthesis protein AmsE [Clostridia bacterium]